MASPAQTVLAVPCGCDNLAYLIVGPARQTVVVDPAASAPLVRVLRERGLEPTAMLFTHAHADHTAGAAGIRAAFPRIAQYGWHGALERLPEACLPLQAGSLCEAGGIPIRVVHTPGHTPDSLCFACGPDLFTGDTLFGGGCGRLLGGTAAELFASLHGLLAAFDGETRVWYGHEYTRDNLRFALSLLPRDRAVRARLAAALRRDGPLCPSTLALEGTSNLFLRCAEPAVAAALGMPGAEPLAVFRALRRRKDSW